MRKRLLFRILTPSLSVSLLLLALGALSGWYVHRQQREASRVLAESVERIRRAEEIVFAAREIRFHLGQLAVTGDREHLAAIPPLCASIEDALNQTDPPVQSGDEPELLEQVRLGCAELEPAVERLLEAPEGGEPGQVQRLHQQLATRRILAPAEEYLETSNAAIIEGGRRSEALAGRVALGLLLLGVCGSVAGLVAGYAIARGVGRSLFQLSVPIKTATGKLEEVIGPIDFGEPSGVQDLDSVVESLTARIAVVVDRLRQSQLDLLRAEQLAALGQLAAGLAHELRNPLMSMKILVQTAGEAGASARIEGRDLTVLEEELTRLETSIQRFLDFARPPTLEKHRFDVRDVVQRILDLVSAQAVRREVVIGSELPETPVMIEADHDQVRQLLLNIVLNSLDAVAPGGHVGIEVGAEPARRPPGNARDAAHGRAWVVIKVTDDGPGIPEELRERIFDPFVSTKETGLGLGLAICRRISEAHGGRITVANSDGGGAEVLVRLPSEPQAETPAAD